MRVLPYVLRKEFLQLKRDRLMLPIVFIAPVLQLILLGYAANLDVEDIPTAVYDADRSVASRQLSESFLSTGVFAGIDPAERHPTSPRDVEELLEAGRAGVVLSIPRGFDAALSTGAATVQIVVDGTNSTEGIAAVNFARSIVADFAAEHGRGTEASELNLRGVRVESRIWYNPELTSRNFMVPGILALLLMVITTLLSSLAIVKEKELGTLEQLNVTPIRSIQLIVGKLAPFVIIGFIDVALVLVVTSFVFRVPIAGSVVLLLVMSTIYLATTLGLGLLISTVSENQQQAMMTAVFFVMVPMVFLSGFAFPIDSMPPVIRLISYLLPLRYYFAIIRGIFLKGAGLSTLWDEGLAMVVFGVAILVLAALRFKKRAG